MCTVGTYHSRHLPAWAHDPRKSCLGGLHTYLSTLDDTGQHWTQNGNHWESRSIDAVAEAAASGTSTVRSNLVDIYRSIIIHLI